MTIRAELVVNVKDALNSPVLVRIRREIPRADAVEGFVVATGRRWVLLHRFSSDMFLDGYTALRLADLKSVRVVGGPESFAVMGLEHFREAPIAPKGIGLDTLKDLLATASRRYRLMAIHTEAVYTDVCYIGEVADLSERRLLMSEITPRATWEPKVSRYQFGDITWVEFGGRYVRALAAVSDRLDSRPDKPNKKGR